MNIARDSWRFGGVVDSRNRFWHPTDSISMIWREDFIRAYLEHDIAQFGFSVAPHMSPKVSRGFKGTLEVLQPDHSWIVAPVEESYPLQEDVTFSDIFSTIRAI